MKPGRNDPCPCGSGKKYKRCCQGKSEARAELLPLRQETEISISELSVKGMAPTPAEYEQLAALFGAGHYAELENRARLFLERCPDSGAAWKMLGATLQRLGKDSLAALQKAAEFLPGDAEAHCNLGGAFMNLGRLNEAKASYRRALQINPDAAETHIKLGMILFEQGRLMEAEASFRWALRVKPDLAQAHYHLGLLLKKQGRLMDAEASYRRALQFRPDLIGAHFDLGVALHDMGRMDEALANFRLALKDKWDWKEVLPRLTAPMVLNTGMVLGPHYPAARFPEARAPVLKERSELEARKNLRIVLIYPPPWQIPSPDEPVPGMPFGPPVDTEDNNLDEDFQTITYGLLTIAAQARRAGHEASIYNLSTCPWRDVVALIARTEADVYGISAFTANRRGMGAVAALVLQHHPQAHITVGGPFVTALPHDTLRYYQDIDTAVVGEGEETFMELLGCLIAGHPVEGIPGTAWRNGDEIVFGPMRPRIKELDALASPFDYFTSSIVMTSRGCPSKCTFCGSFAMWGKLLRFHSAESCLDIYRKALARLPVSFLAIKDDTFTAHRRRANAICDAIIENRMNFLWSCDTRVDSIDDELLYKMRLAGCQRISLGVESGSPQILESIHKRTTPEMVLEATRSAQKYGMHVRYYMIIGNRGETPETVQQSIDLIKLGRPSYLYFCCLGFSPGTEEWAILREKQGLTQDIFFTNDFMELTVASNRREEWARVLVQIQCEIGSYGFDYTVEEREAVIGRLPHLHSAHVELANAYFRAGRLDEAASALDRAEELGFPIEGLIFNQRACIALARNDVSGAFALLERALDRHPHHVVKKNRQNLRIWANNPVDSRGKPPVFDDSVQAADFQMELDSATTAPI